MRMPIIAANWKMHKTLKEAENYASEFPVDEEILGAAEIVICPPFTALETVGQALKGTGIKLAAQNMHQATQGAFTGEVSPLMLKDLGCEYVILGHSERRHIFGEKDNLINEKVKSALAHGLKPILCIGETLEERQGGRTEKVCRDQLLQSLAGVEEKDIAQVVIAYEPVWAIGTGVNASAEDAEKTIGYIREVLSGKYSPAKAAQIRIQYGGSVKPGNIADFMKQQNIDGALVGGASLEAASFYSIVQGALV